MSAPHPLSAVEVEALRQMRTRLNKPAVSEAAAATLLRAALTVLARNGVEATADAAGLAVVDAAVGRSVQGFLDAAKDASLANLAVLAAVLAKRAAAGEARAFQAGGAPQALISRRLVLAGREGVEARG